MTWLSLKPQPAFRLGEDAVIVRRHLSGAAQARIAKAIAQETAEEVASSPRGSGAPPPAILRCLRQLRWYSQRVVEARARLTPEQRAAILGTREP